MRERVIIDTDIGDDIDDALALAMAVNSPELEVAGVTTVFRNTEARARLAISILKAMGRSEIPVIPGIGLPLMNRPADTMFETVNVHEIPGQYSEEMNQEKCTYSGDAIDFFVETLTSSDEPVTLVPIGPLTNIAALLIKKPDIKSKIKRIVLMGGAYFINQSEYNILCDPEAARIVFDSGIAIAGVGMDVTGKCQLTYEELEKIRNNNRPVSNFLYKLISRFMGYANHLPILHDPLAVAVSFQPDLVKMQNKRIAVETEGEFTRGMTFNISNSRWWEKDFGYPTVQVCSEVDRDEFVKLFLDRILR